jgi:hypothetical protein
MTLSTDSIIQQATGSFESSSGSVTLPGGTEAGSAVLIIAGLGGDNSTTYGLQTPSGFTAVGALADAPAHATPYMWIKPSASAAETTWTLNANGGSPQVVWAVFEIPGLDTDWPGKVYIKMSPGLPGESPVSSQSTVVSDPSESYGALALAMFFGTNTTPETPVFSDYENGFFEIATETRSNASRAHTLAVAALPTQVLGTKQCTVAVTPSAYVAHWVVVLTGLDSHHAPNVTACFGAEIGTITSIDSSDGTYPGAWDGVVGSPEISTEHPRSGSYGLKFSSTSAAENLTWGQKAGVAQGTLGTTNTVIPVWSERFHVYFETSLPSVDTELASVEAGSLANGVVIRYVAASQKIGVKVGTGSEVLSDTTVAADVHIGIDYLYDPRATTHTCDWAVDYDADPGDTVGSVAQTQASTSGMTAGGVTTVRKGHTTSITATYYMDDIVASKWRKTFPIGDVRIMPLKVDPAGTPTVSGSSANFRTFTSNGTLATWTADGTRTALDDIPPTIGATSDGLTQVAVATTEYVEVPMETFACAPDYAPMGGRWYWAGWAASGNPASFKCRISDGTSPNFAVFGLLDSTFDDSSLVWVTRIHNRIADLNTFYQFTQAKVDGLAAQFGFSEDANPDAGVHAVLFELIIKPAEVIGLFEAEGGTFNVYGRLDPNSAAIVSLLATTPAGTRGGTLTWTDGGVDGSQYVGPNTTGEKSFASSSIEDVTSYGFSPDPG